MSHINITIAASVIQFFRLVSLISAFSGLDKVYHNMVKWSKLHHFHTQSLQFT